MRHSALAAVLAAMLAAGCSPTVDIRGNLPDPQDLAQVKVGETKRDDVIKLLGNPSTSGTFEKETWYYIGQRTEQRLTVFNPVIKDQKVVLIRFNGDGTVEELQQFGLKDGKPVDVVERVTPSRGKDLTILQQLVGNIGRFGSEGSALSKPGTDRSGGGGSGGGSAGGY